MRVMPRQRSVLAHRCASTALLGAILALAACVGVPNAATTSRRRLTTFQGSGDEGASAHFTTGEQWVLSWNCNPYVDGVATPFGLTVTDNTPDNYGVGAQVLDTECSTSNDNGVMGIRQTREQWLTVGTGGVGGPWMLSVQVASNDLTAAVLPTPAPTLAPTLTPAPTVPPAGRLPFTFSGSLSPTRSYHPFTASVQWHFTVTCANDPADTGAPEAIGVSVHQPSATNALGFPDAQVGQELDAYCDGHTAYSDTVNPGGFSPGSYDWQIVTLGNWTVTVLAEQ